MPCMQKGAVSRKIVYLDQIQIQYDVKTHPVWKRIHRYLVPKRSGSVKPSPNPMGRFKKSRAASYKLSNSLKGLLARPYPIPNNAPKMTRNDRAFAASSNPSSQLLISATPMPNSTGRARLAATKIEAWRRLRRAVASARGTSKAGMRPWKTTV